MQRYALLKAQFKAGVHHGRPAARSKQSSNQGRILVFLLINPSDQCAKAAAKSNQVLGQILSGWLYMEGPRKPDPIIRGVCEASPPDIWESTAEVHQASFRNWKSPRQLGLSTLKARRERGDMIRNLQHHNWQVWCRQEHLVYTTGTQEGADSTRATSGHLNLKRREAK